MRDEEKTREQLTAELVAMRRKAAELERWGKELKQTEKGLQEYATNIVDSSIDMIIAVDLDRNITEFNRAAQEIFGYQRDEILGKHVSVLYVNSREGSEIHQTTITQGRCVQETLNKRKNGEVFPCLVSASVLQGATGEAIGVMGVSRDITQGRKWEERLRFQAQLLDSVREAVVATDLEGKIIYWGKGAQNLYGYYADEIIGKPAHSIVHPNGRTEDKERVRQVYEKGEWNGRYVQERKDGIVFWVEANLSLVTDKSGAPCGMIGIFRDITVRKRVEEEQARLSLAVEQATETIMITETDGTIVYVNPAFEKVSGYSRSEVIGQDPSILKSGKHDPAHYQEMWSTLNRGKVWAGHFINKRKDESLYEEDAIISPMFDDDGRVIHYVAVKRDVTQEVTLEGQLRQAQKMEAIGTLAGGVAHDFNNLLTTIIGFSELALYEDMSDRAKEYISRIPKQGKRAAELISQLLTFSRRAVTRRRELQLVPLIKETVKLLERTVRETITIRWNSPDEVWLVNADPTQVQQVIMNLSVNANHAMPQGGELTINIENISLDEAYCKRYPYARPGDYVCLSVSDTGQGMTPETQEHIFEPFFTTKATGEGTGLGLAMVYGIVKSHEGHINVESSLGEGTAFKVFLPALRGVQAAAEKAEEGLVGGAETVLLVEDEETVLFAGQSMLKALGYNVLTSYSGEDAIEIYRSQKDEISLVITDMVMSRMSGQELFASLKMIHPAVNVLLVSGYSLAEDVADLSKTGLRGFVQKPFNIHTLDKAVREALAIEVEK